MKRAFILYTAADAERNGFLAERYCAAFASLGAEAAVLIVDGKRALSVAAELKRLGADVIINRTRSHALAGVLEASGLRVSNPSKVCRIANDKLLTFGLLRDTVPMLPTVRAEELGNEPQLGYPFVLKPRGGHGGKGVAMISSAEEYSAYAAVYGLKNRIAQPVASELGRDMRVYIIGGKPAAAMLRVASNDFRSNFCLGGEARFVPLDSLSEDECAIISAVCQRLPLHYAGVDIMRDGGHAVLNEIEDPVGARMLYTNTDIDPAALHAKFALEWAEDGRHWRSD